MVIAILIPISLKSLLTSTSGHSSNAVPIALFSLWNDTAPTIDGQIVFNSSSLSTEWSAAAVYYLVDKVNSPDSKLLLQNNDANFFVGLDATSQLSDPVTTWGFGVYLDRDHNGILTSFDRAIFLNDSGSGEIVSYNYYSQTIKNWIEIDSGPVGIAFTSGILVSTAYTDSFFESNNHRQYEVRIPFTEINVQSGEVTGMAFEIFQDFENNDDEITWPYISSTPSELRTNAGLWGDIHFGLNTSLSYYYSKYSVEENTNIKSSAVGYNNGTFITTGDINGDGDQELIVSSNRTVAGDSNLLAIYDHADGGLIRNWTSWTTSHQSKMFLVRSIATHDFDGNDEDEIFLSGEDSRILRLSSWNAGNNDFDSSDYAFSHTSGLTGYLAIGDINNDGTAELVFGDQNGYVNALKYNSLTNSFRHDKRSPFTVAGLKKIHSITLGDMDDDGETEVLFQGQTDSLIPETKLYIYLRFFSKFLDNPEDNLPSDSAPSTADRFGHTILVEDVDNDGITEIVTVGQNYLKIFGKDTFLAAFPPLEIQINDGLQDPKMGGGAAVADLNGDSLNELIFSFNNGTIMVLNITDSGSDNLSYDIEWSADYGSSFGKRNSLKVLDIDNDNENETITGDVFGQILILGKSSPPDITITSPTTGSIFSSSPIEVAWDATDDLAIHHYDISVGEVFNVRIPGSQTSFMIPISAADNLIKVNAFDVNGKNTSDSVIAKYNVLSPQIDISSPENYLMTANDTITVLFTNSNPNGDFDHYEIYVNGFKEEDYWIFNFYVASLPSDGIYNITIVGIDYLSNEGKSSIFITRDRTSPNIAITSPISGSYVKSDEIDIQWSASDSLSGISHFNLYLDNEYLLTTTNQFQTIFLDREKTYQINVEAFDLVGNSQFHNITVKKDSIQPKITILYPESGFISSSNQINLAWETIDNLDGSGIHHSEVVVNHVTKYTGTDDSILLDLVDDGFKDILVTSYDRAGNSKTIYLSVIVDQTDPFVKIISPEDNFETGLTYAIISWESQDNGTGINKHEIYVDGVLTETITDPTIDYYQVDLSLDSTSIITVQALDYLNRTSSDSVSIIQNSTLPTINIIDPANPMSYYSTASFDISWDIANIPNLNGFEILRNGTSMYNITNLSDRSYTIDLGEIPLDQYHLHNLTIIANTTNPDVKFYDYCWIMIDQTKPVITITTPENYTMVIHQGLYIQWTSSDFGSGLKNIKMKVNGEYLVICFCSRNDYYLIFNVGDGLYTIEIEAFDFANNMKSSLLYLDVYLLLPDFTTDLPNTYYTQTGIFQFELLINNPQTGVKRIQVKLDNNEVYTRYHYETLIITQFSVLINITDSHYNGLLNEHTMIIGILDSFNRESLLTYTIIIDNEPPELLGSISIDSQSITSNSHELQLYEDSAQNNHSFSITFTDNYAVQRVTITIVGVDYNKTFEMIPNPTTRLDIVTFSITINFGNLIEENYEVIFTAYDFAGNKQNITLNLTILPEEKTPWLFQGNNLIYFIVSGIFVIVLSLVWTVGLRKPLLNRNWQDNVIAVIYVRNTGLTCVYAPYYPDIIQEEQLFGGAMIAIQSLLDEISVEEKKRTRLETLEIGDKTLLIASGIYGFGALLTKKVKPKHKNSVKSFTKKFESIYKRPLESSYYVSSTEFTGSLKLVEQYFGSLDNGERVIAEEGLSQQLIELKEKREKEPNILIDIETTNKYVLKKITPIDDLLSKISREAKNRLLKVIENTPKVIIGLVENNFDQTEITLQEITNDLEFLLRIERSNKDFDYFIRTMINLTLNISSGIENGRSDNVAELQNAIESASKIWFDEIVEKWSA